MPENGLLLLLDEVRGKTLRILRSMPAEYALWAPPGLNNTILWHGGHAFVLVESITMKCLGRTPQIPDGWDELFRPGSHPALVPADRWPALGQVIAELESQQTRLGKLMGVLGQSELDAPSPTHPNRTVRGAIFHALHDEACHCGEISLLGKMQAAAKREV